MKRNETDRAMFSSLETNPLGSTSTIPLPMMTSTESLRANGLERNTGIWYLLKHNWRQASSLVPGLALLCALGNLHVSWTLWRLYLYVFDYQNVETHVLLAWFVGVAGGAMLGALLNKFWSKILIYYSIAVALIPVSTFFVLHQASSHNLLLIGRALAGLLYGIILVTLILHIADNSHQYMRRHFIWTISTINILPTVLLADFISTVTGFCDVNASIGVMMFAMAIFTLIFMPCTYESIVFLLGNGTDLRALEIMLKLRNESRNFIRRDFNELKMMVVEDFSDNGNIFSNGNSRPLILVLLLRILNVLLTSNCVYWIFLANVWFDYQHWMRPMNLTTQMLGIVQEVFQNQSTPSETESNSNDESTPFDGLDPLNFNGTTMSSSIDESISPTSDSWFNTTDFPYDMLSTELYENSTDDTVSLATESNIVPVDLSSIANHLFIHSAYSYRLPPLQIAQFILIVSVIKIVAGMPILCLAEKFQIYRNRIIFKVTLCIGVINWIFFMATMVCSFTDDSLLFTFFACKLLSIIYGLYLLIAFSIDTVGYCELSESFSLTKRYGCIAFIVIGEYLFHAIAILLIMNALFRFYFHVVQSAVICFICYLLLKRMPNECLNCTLRSARDKHFVKMATTST